MLPAGSTETQSELSPGCQPLAYGGWNPAAEASGLGRSSLIEAAEDGKLIVRKSGRRTVILRDDLLAYLRSLPLRQATKAAA